MAQSTCRHVPGYIHNESLALTVYVVLYHVWLKYVINNNIMLAVIVALHTCTLHCYIQYHSLSIVNENAICLFISLVDSKLLPNTKLAFIPFIYL